MNSTPLILSLETATLGGSVFLGRGDLPLAGRTSDPNVSHSNSLLSDIAFVLEETGLSMQDVELLACAVGPGSFTGLRIGIATLKALAATLGLPCVGIPTLRAVAHAAGPSLATVALLPAGRGEVYCQLFSVSEDSTVTEVDAAAHLSPDRLIQKYGALDNVTWAGNGAHAQREILKRAAGERGFDFTAILSSPQTGATGWKLTPEIENLARYVAALAVQSFVKGEMHSPQSLTAIYVRPSDAEIKQQCL